MGLSKHIEDVRAGIKAGRYGNDAGRYHKESYSACFKHWDRPPTTLRSCAPEFSLGGRPDLAREFFARLRSGWFVGTNVSHAAIRQIVEMACEVAGLRYGVDVVVHIGE